MGEKINKLFFIMNKALNIVCLLAIVSSMSCLHMPDALCNPAKNIGGIIAKNIMTCANASITAKFPKAADMAKKIEGGEKAMATKMVAMLLSKVGCKRRMNILGDLAKHVHKVGSAIVKGAKKVVAKVAPIAIKLACQNFGSQCPKACDSAVDAAAPQMKNFHIPTKCFSKTAKDACHQACTDLCKGK